MTRSCCIARASWRAASAKPTSTRSRRRPTATSRPRPSTRRHRRRRVRTSSCATCGRMEDRHGGTDVSRRSRSRDHSGDGARPQRRLPRRGRRRRRRRLQGHRRAARALRSGARARHADLRAGDPRRGDGRRDDRAAADRRDHVRGLLRGVLGPRRQSDRQELVHDRRPGELPAGDQIRQRRWAALRSAALASRSRTGRWRCRGSRSSRRRIPPT